MMLQEEEIREEEIKKAEIFHLINFQVNKM